jgi:hypothetical protein
LEAFAGSILAFDSTSRCGGTVHTHKVNNCDDADDKTANIESGKPRASCRSNRPERPWPSAICQRENNLAIIEDVVFVLFLQLNVGCRYQSKNPQTIGVHHVTKPRIIERLFGPAS